MKVLLVEREAAETSRLGAIVKAAGHQLVTAATTPLAKVALAEAPQLALIGTYASDEQALELVRLCRTAPAGGRLLVALLVRDPSEDYLVRGFEAGADFELRGSASASLLTAWLRTMTRLTRADKAPGATTARPPVVAPTDAMSRTAHSHAWRAASETFIAAASTFLTLPVTAGDVSAAATTIEHASSIVLSNVDSQLELRVAVGADHKSAQTLALHLFGPEETGLTDDLLGELANIFMGVMKTALGETSLAYTAGLPAPTAPEEVLRPAVTYKHQEAFVLLVNDAKVVIHLGLRSKANVFLSASCLGEGMVLAKHIHNSRGMLLLSSGTRLSLSMIERVRTAIEPKAQVEVMAP